MCAANPQTSKRNVMGNPTHPNRTNSKGGGANQGKTLQCSMLRKANPNTIVAPCYGHRVEVSKKSFYSFPTVELSTDYYPYLAGPSLLLHIKSHHKLAVSSGTNY